MSVTGEKTDGAEEAGGQLTFDLAYETSYAQEDFIVTWRLSILSAFPIGRLLLPLLPEIKNLVKPILEKFGQNLHKLIL